MIRSIFLCTLILLTVDLAPGQTPTVRILLKSGRANLDTGHLDAALADANKAIELEPKNVEGYVLRYQVRVQIKPEVDTSDDCDKIIALAPNRYDIDSFHNARARLRWWKKDYDGSVHEMSKAISIRPDDAQYYEMRSFYALDAGNLELSRADYYKSIQLKPGSPSPFVRRGFIHYHMHGEFLSALADYDTAIEWNPEDAIAFADRGIVHALLGHIDEAIADFRKAKALEPDSIADKVPKFAFCAPYRELSSFLLDHPNARGFEVRAILNLMQDRNSEAEADFHTSLFLEPALKSEIDKIRTELLRKL